MSRPSHLLAQHRGFTLMEMTLTLVLLGILSVVGTTMVANSFMATRIFNKQQNSSAVASYAMWRMAREIQEVQYTASTSNVSLTTMTGSHIAFVKSGIDSTPTTTVDLTYSSGTQILSLSYNGGAASTLATPVSALNFTYLDGSTPPIQTAIANNVRYVAISMTMTPSGAPPITLNTLVALRNI